MKTVELLLNKERLLILRARLFHDHGAFSALVRMHQGRVRAFLLRLSRDYDQADDLAQETFIRAFRKLDSFRDQGSFSAWLFSIAHNCFLEQHRARQRRLQVYRQWEQEMSIALQIQPDRFHQATEQQIDLENALACLPPAQVAALTLCHSYGFSHSEAAGILQVPLGTVKTHISRGKERLARLLDSGAPEEETPKKVL